MYLCFLDAIPKSAWYGFRYLSEIAFTDGIIIMWSIHFDMPFTATQPSEIFLHQWML